MGQEANRTQQYKVSFTHLLGNDSGGVPSDTPPTHAIPDPIVKVLSIASFTGERYWRLLILAAVMPFGVRLFLCLASERSGEAFLRGVEPLDFP